MTNEVHCCSEMEYHLRQGELGLIYIPKFREYGIRYQESESIQVILFCPWCGKKLPPSLRDQWFDEIEKLGLEPEGNLPPQFISDEWWRSH